MNRNRAAIQWVLLAIMVVSLSAKSFSQIAVGVSVRIGPPPLPVYAQPICPGPGYYWTPGYWAWDDDDGYYWVPGTWVVAPVGMLWTPGYWGWGDGFYVWHAGYWGPHVGFYGGINYGFGYTGVGFVGGEWRGRDFYYNRSVTNVSVTNVTNVYNKTVIVNNTRNVSYNGGQGGIEARPSRQEEMAAHERHEAALPMQAQHERIAGRNRENFAAVNHGRPAVAATVRPGDFSSRSVIRARAAGGEYHAPAMSPRQARVNSGPANRSMSPANRGSSNPGFRPFTPPARNGASNANMSRGNENRPNQNRPPQNRQNQPYQNRSNEMRPQNERSMPHSAPPQRESAPRQDFRPSGPPPHSAPPQRESAPRQDFRPSGPPPHSAPPQRESAPRQDFRPSGPPPHSAPPQRESAPRQDFRPSGPPPHSAPPQRESAPRQDSRPSGPPPHQAPPREGHHQGH